MLSRMSTTLLGTAHQRPTYNIEKPKPAEVGWLYLLENPAIPGVFKIGRAVNLDQRTAAHNALCGLGDIPQWRLTMAVQSNDYKALEYAVHTELSACRIRGRREMFRVPADAALVAIEKMVGPLRANPPGPILSRKPEQSRKRPKIGLHRAGLQEWMEHNYDRLYARIWSSNDACMADIRLAYLTEHPPIRADQQLTLGGVRATWRMISNRVLKSRRSGRRGPHVTP
jgi:hypothetical protein